VFLISGCATSVPVTPKFPEAPPTLLEKCKTLDTLDLDRVLLSELIENVMKNYLSSRECSTKYDGWIDWYETQKKIFNDIK
jgi:hypothetical protein